VLELGVKVSVRQALSTFLVFAKNLYGKAKVGGPFAHRNRAEIVGDPDF